MFLTKYVFILLALIPQFIFAQEKINVYPYQHEIDFPKELFHLKVNREQYIIRDSLTQKIIKIDTLQSNDWNSVDKTLVNKLLTKQLLLIRKNNPALFYDLKIDIAKDIAPYLKPLPDGKYIQYYKDLPEVNGDLLTYNNSKIASIFYLKDNKLNGPAIWLSVSGDTLKKGQFKNGLKEGLWSIKSFQFEPNYQDKLMSNPANWVQLFDTNVVTFEFLAGVENGAYHNYINDTLMVEGNYKNGKGFGTWTYYQWKEKKVNNQYIPTKEKIIGTRFTLTDKRIKIKDPLIRTQFIPYDLFENPALTDTINLPYYEDLYSFGQFFNFFTSPEIEGLELEEEKYTSYEGEGEEEGDYYAYYEGNEVEYDSISDIITTDITYQSTFKFKGNQKKYSFAELIDSVGYFVEYDGIYETYYSNGQLRYKFEVKDGKIQREEPIYWENGNKLSEINYLEKENQFQQLTYDFDGKLLQDLRFDKKGNFVKEMLGLTKIKPIVIDGLNFNLDDFTGILEYYIGDDTLNKKVVTEETLLNKSYFSKDTSLSVLKTFNPITRALDLKVLSIDGTTCFEQHAEFGEDFEFVNAQETFTFGKLTNKTQINGSFPAESQFKDSLHQSRVLHWTNSFENTFDDVLHYENQPFNGKIKITTNKKEFSVKSNENELKFDLALDGTEAPIIEKIKTNFFKKKKKTFYTSILNENMLFGGAIGSNVCSSLFSFLNSVLALPTVELFEYQDENGNSVRVKSEKKVASFDKTVEGQFRNGKPDGLWITRNQFGQITSEVTFTNGKINGDVKYYAIKTADRSVELDVYDGANETNEFSALMQDSVPEKPVYYLSHLNKYKNGLLNGTQLQFNWLKDTVSYSNFVDGSQEGLAIEKNKLARTISHFKLGVRDGFTQTYLKLPQKTPQLLYDLNFRNGVLQGESKAYHLNGNVAKKGFFLTGQPIDDFMAFDSLGKQYQYVKFQYNQPVEEKIWEENQLSLRYQFDWRDSIYFNTADITESTSLENLMYQLGMNSSANSYFGRPSLVNKNGVNYHFTKYYPNDTIARDGSIKNGKKIGCWTYFDYSGTKLYEIEYFDSIVKLHDSIYFKSKGELVLFDEKGEPIAKSLVVEKVEKYDCSHADHHEVRMLFTFWQASGKQDRINGYVKNYYDNGSLMNEGQMKDGLATGIWKFYDPNGNLNLVGEYVHGKRNGRWLKGDLSDVRYLGDFCLNPNLPNLQELISYEENLRDITVLNYRMNVVKDKTYYGINLNNNKLPSEK